MTVDPRWTLLALAKRADAVAALARALAEDWQGYEHVEASLALPTMRSSVGASGRSGGDVSNPVLDQVVSHQHFNESAALVEEWWGFTVESLGAGRELQRRMATTFSSVRDLTAEKRAARCDGSVDPQCVELVVVKNYRGTGRALCSKCRSRLDREEARADA